MAFAADENIYSLPIEREAVAENSAMIKVNTHDGSEIYVNKSIKDSIVFTQGNKCYMVDDANNLVEVDKNIAVPYATYSKSFTIDNGVESGFFKYVPKGVNVHMQTIGDTEYREMNAWSNNINYVSVRTSLYGYGTHFVALRDENIHFSVKNLSAAEATWEINVTF